MKERISFNTKFNVEYAQTFIFKGNLPTKSTSVQNKVGKGGKRSNELPLITQNSIFSMHKHIHSKATYLLLPQLGTMFSAALFLV